MKTISKLRLLGCPDDVLSNFTNLPTTDSINDAIIGCLMVVMITADVEALQFCDEMDKLVDNKSSKTFIEMLRNGKYTKNYVNRYI